MKCLGSTQCRSQSFPLCGIREPPKSDLYWLMSNGNAPKAAAPYHRKFSDKFLQIVLHENANTSVLRLASSDLTNQKIIFYELGKRNSNAI